MDIKTHSIDPSENSHRNIHSTGMSGRDPHSKTPDPIETFQKTPHTMPDKTLDLRKFSKRLFSGEVSLEWSFKAGSTCMLNILVTPAGKIICQDQEKIYSIDKNTGKKDWEQVKERGGISSFASDPGGTVFADCIKTGKLLALDGSTGEEKWNYDIKNLDYFGVESSKVDNKLLIDGNASSQKKIICLDGKTGKVEWETGFKSTLVSKLKVSPDGSAALVNLGESFAVLDTKTGEKKWEYPTKDAGISSTLEVGLNGDVFFCTEDNNIHAINGKSGKEKWTYPIDNSDPGSLKTGEDGTLYHFDEGKIIALDKDNGNEKWRYSAPCRNDILHHIGFTRDGSLYAYNFSGGRLISLDSMTGKQKETHRIKKKWTKAQIGPDGLIYFAGKDNKIHAIKTSIKREDIEKALQKDDKKEEVPKIEMTDKWVIIGGVKIPINKPSPGFNLISGLSISLSQ